MDNVSSKHGRMTQHDWDVIVNPPQRYRAFFIVDGDEVEEQTTANTLESATKALQPGWKVPIRVHRLHVA